MHIKKWYCIQYKIESVKVSGYLSTDIVKVSHRRVSSLTYVIIIRTYYHYLGNFINSTHCNYFPEKNTHNNILSILA